MVVGEETVCSVPSGDSSDPEGLEAARPQGTSVKEVGQKTAPTEVEGVSGKVTEVELMVQGEHEER